MRKAIGFIITIAVLVAGAASLAWLWPNSRVGRSIRDLIFREGPRFSDLSASCGAPGQSCCKWPKAIPGLDPRYCEAGAGCDIVTNTCVSPCGGGGQVCCDGPDTYGPQGDISPTGALYCTNGDCVPRKQMCAAGACTRDTAVQRAVRQDSGRDLLSARCGDRSRFVQDAGSYLRVWRREHGLRNVRAMW